MRKKLVICSMFVAVAALFSGCVEKRGCTDQYSDNYDPEATQDDDTCVPTRLKFVGNYEGRGTIETETDVLSSFDQVTISIEDSTAFDEDQLIMGISNFDAQLYALSAVTSGQYGLLIPNQSLGSFTYFGDGSISGRVLDVKMTRIEKIEIAPEEFEFDTLKLNLFGIKEIEE